MCGAHLKALPEGVQRVATLLERAGHLHLPVMLDAAARTVQQAAQALGVCSGQIAKSIVFRRHLDDVAVLVMTSGDQRVDEKKVAAQVCWEGQRLGRADAEFVKTKTGFSIGGVSPLAHATAVVVLMDHSLFRFKEVWAAAGHPQAVFCISPQQLEKLTAAPVADFAVVMDEEKLALQRAATLVGMRFDTLGEQGEMISPCIGVCRMEPVTDRCLGCFRTRDEIARWSHASDDEKRAVWSLIRQRMGAVKV